MPYLALQKVWWLRWLGLLGVTVLRDSDSGRAFLRFRGGPLRRVRLLDRRGAVAD